MRKKIHEKILPHGHFTLKLLDLEGNVLEVHEADNVVTDVFLNAMANQWAGNPGTFVGSINYVAVGTGANTASASDTTLQTELQRVVFTPGTRSVTGGTYEVEFYFGPTDAIGNLKEIGAFADATGTPGSPTERMFDRANIDINKTNQNSLIILLTVSNQGQ